MRCLTRRTRKGKRGRASAVNSHLRPTIAVENKKMNRKDLIRLAVVVIFIVLTVPAFLLNDSSAAQQTSSAGQPNQIAVPPAQEEMKNLQVLKGLSRQQVITVMQSWSKALGVECNYCHVRPFEADTPLKETARLMQRGYVEGLKHKDGRAISCQDCHRGHAKFLPTRPVEDAR